MSYIVVLNPLVIGTGADSAGNILGVPQVAGEVLTARLRMRLR